MRINNQWRWVHALTLGRFEFVLWTDLRVFGVGIEVYNRFGTSISLWVGPFRAVLEIL